MIRCAECGQVECDKESCPGWTYALGIDFADVSLEPAVLKVKEWPRETATDRHRFAMQFQNQPYPRDEDAQRE